MKDDEAILANLKKSYLSFLKFLGLTYDEDLKTIEYADNFDPRAKQWFTPGNHNFMRLTRILKCLVIFGLNDEANALFDILKEIKQTQS